MGTLSQSSDCIIDHIVLLVSTEDFDNPPSWLSTNFNILEGGTHSGQASRNKLIVFADGTYLELFNWFDEPPADDAKDQPMRVWGKKQPGLIDFALSSGPQSTIESHFETRIARLRAEDGDGRLGVGYTPPEAGGRTRKDGVEVKWKVSRPEFSEAANTPDNALFPNGRMDAPFFCYDVTSRGVRVPFEDEEKTTHPCGAVGVAAVEVLASRSKMEAYLKLYSSILGSAPKAVDENDEEEGWTFQVGLPVERATPSVVRIRAPQTEQEISWLTERGVGISKLVLLGAGHEGHVKGQLGAGEIASTIWLG